MLPTLKPGDQITVDTMAYTSNVVKRFDLVAIQFSTRSRPMVKRVIAIPGDNVTIENNRMTIAWKTTDCPDCRVIKPISQKAGKTLFLQLKRYNHLIPKGSLVVLGDNHENTFDSMDYGLISTGQVLGKVMIN